MAGEQDWRRQMEERKAGLARAAGPPPLDAVARREVEKVRDVVRKQAEAARDGILEAVFNPAFAAPEGSLLRELEPDIRGYDVLLSDDSLAGQRQTCTPFWQAARAVAFADEDPDLDPIGAIHPTQVIDAFRAIIQSVEHRRHHQSNIACMQQGKSGSASAKYLFHPLVRWVLFQQKLHSFYLVPNYIGLAEQIGREFAAKYQLFAPFRLRHPTRCPDGISIRDLFDQELKPRGEEHELEYNPARHILRMTRKKSLQQKYHRKVSRIVGSPDEWVQVLIDESDAAAGRGGVLDGMVGQFVRDVVRGDPADRVCIFLHTASPQEHQNTEGFLHILEHQGRGYCGLPRYEGEPYPNRDRTAPGDAAEARPPLVVPYASLFGVNESSLDFGAYKSRVAWMQRVKGVTTRDGRRPRNKAEYEQVWRRRRATLEPEWQEYCRHFESTLAWVVYSLLTDKTVRVAEGGSVEFPHARGVVLRPIDRNSDDRGSADNLAGALEQSFHKYHKDICVIRFYGENAGRTAKDLIREKAGTDSDYVVIVTGKARRGDAFPRHCAFALDLTRKPSALTAALQGLFGRMCGWGKRTAFFGSQATCDVINTYARDGHAAAVAALTKIGYRVELADPTATRRARPRGPGHTTAEVHRDRVESYVDRHPDAQPVLDWLAFCRQELNRQKDGGGPWKHAVVLGKRRRGRGKGVVTTDDENCRTFLERFAQLAVADVLERHPALCTTDAAGTVQFRDVSLLRYEPDVGRRRRHLEEHRAGEASEFVSTTSEEGGLCYGDHVERRDRSKETTRHTMGRVTRHRRRGPEAEGQPDDYHSVQLWWEYTDGEGSPVAVPRVTLVLRRPHPPHTVEIARPSGPLRTLPDSIYSNEVTEAAGLE